MPELRERLPKDKVDLKLLLVDGQSYNFLFPASASAREIVHHVFEHWPSDWEENSCVLKPDNSQVLRLIYRGRFLGQSTTLSSLSIPAGKTTVLHMVIRETMPDNQQSDSSGKLKTVSNPQSRCCTIL